MATPKTVICPTEYPETSEMEEHFQTFPFPLSPFQKWAIEAIVGGHDVLVTAHTGSGKTLPAEFAIRWNVQKGHKVIYTSPIKALSNQKYHEFKAQFPHISFGILTGDIKENPDAAVVIMTTEILQKMLRQGTMGGDVRCAIFDEVHYINDADRGGVWEEVIMRLSSANVQKVMLSATLDAPEKFVNWIASINPPGQAVYLTGTHERVVPLLHHAFLTCGESAYKKITKEQASELRSVVDRLHPIGGGEGCRDYRQLIETRKLCGYGPSRSWVLNQCAKLLVEKEMTPAIVFGFSKRKLEEMAREITVPLWPFDSKYPYTMARECETILRKLPNHAEYLELPEYRGMVALLEKGIAVHHAGIMPVLKEMVEILFGRGMIQLLFATETFSVGINMPTKTVVFTGVVKHDDHCARGLFPHEYTQMSGRAGRRGIDTVGHVVHLVNLYGTDVTSTSLAQMMSGVPQRLTSKLRVTFDMVLSEGGTLTGIPSMRQLEGIEQLPTLLGQADALKTLITVLERQSTDSRSTSTPESALREYFALKSNGVRNAEKKRLRVLEDTWPNLARDLGTYQSLVFQCEKLRQLEETITVAQNVLGREWNRVTMVLAGVPDHVRAVAGKIREVPCLVMGELVAEGHLNSLEVEELVGLFSCFTAAQKEDDDAALVTSSSLTESILLELSEKYRRLEETAGIDTGTDYHVHFRLSGVMRRWCAAGTVEECAGILRSDGAAALGDFVKAVLKIVAIAAELEAAAECTGNVVLLSRLREVPKRVLKYVASAQSLYV